MSHLIILPYVSKFVRPPLDGWGVSILVGGVLMRSRFVFQMMLAATLQWHAPYMALVSP